MTTVLRYFINMLPYICIVLPIYLVVRIIFIKIRALPINWLREMFLLVFTLYVAGLASQTILPDFDLGVDGFRVVVNDTHKTNIIPFKVLFETYEQVFLQRNIYYFLINFLGNIVMFVPIGLFLPLLWGLSGKKTLLLGFASSLLIEICQLFLVRGTDIDDLILNTTGVLLGLLLLGFIPKNWKMRISNKHS